MICEIKPGRAIGSVNAPRSKSYAHRMLICAALSNGKSVIHGIPDCVDVRATVDCLKKLGAEITLSDGIARVVGFDPTVSVAERILNARESGSTLRFLIPLAFLSGNEIRFSGEGRLMKRPMDVYRDLCVENGIYFLQDTETITVKGKLKDGDIEIPGNVSSQFVTGILFILPFLGGDRRLKLLGNIESQPYIDMTVEIMHSFGIDIEYQDERTILVRGGSMYRSATAEVEGDWSGAAFLNALGLFGEVRVKGLNESSLQGDKVQIEYFKALCEGRPTLSIEACPDLGPILFAVAAEKNGAIFTGTKRLKIKESDRAAVMAEELYKFGADVRVYDNSVEIFKKPLHTPTVTLSGHSDHRVVMSLAVLATIYGGKIDGAEAISKSYPEFFDDISKLKIELNTYDN